MHFIISILKLFKTNLFFFFLEEAITKIQQALQFHFTLIQVQLNFHTFYLKKVYGAIYNLPHSFCICRKGDV